MEVSIHWEGRPEEHGISFAQLEFSMSSDRIARTRYPGLATLFTDDSLEFVLGTPKSATLVMDRFPRSVPFLVPLPHEALVALATSRKAILTWGNQRMRASSEEVASFNALLRTLICGPQLPESRN